MLMLILCYLNIAYISSMFRKSLYTIVVFLVAFSFSLSAKIVHVEYYPNGNVKIEVIKMKKGLHRVNQYFEDGTIMETGYTKNGMFQGRWRRYDEQGEVVATAYYHNNRRIGAWQHLNPWTHSSMQVRYENGNAVSFKEFDQQGKLIASGDRIP